MQLSLNLNEINILLSTIKVNAHLGNISFCKGTIRALRGIQKIREGKRIKILIYLSKQVYKQNITQIFKSS